jgi:hypothetical protein
MRLKELKKMTKEAISAQTEIVDASVRELRSQTFSYAQEEMKSQIERLMMATTT